MEEGKQSLANTSRCTECAEGSVSLRRRRAGGDGRDGDDVVAKEGARDAKFQSRQVQQIAVTPHDRGCSSACDRNHAMRVMRAREARVLHEPGVGERRHRDAKAAT